MCGICGYYSPNASLSQDALAEATRSLAHRGPDGHKTWQHPSGIAGLGHTRLAIIDLVCGQQPMSSIDGQLIVVFNGEIYNYRLLRTELEKLGHVFRTNSDTEVLLCAYRQWGVDSLIRLNGMFAFAIFDQLKRKLFLARDRTGIKPLYYSSSPKGIVFGSELKALLAWPEIPRRVNFPGLMDFLTLTYPLPPATCFRDCHELEPGSYLEFSDEGLRKVKYWKWERQPVIGRQSGWLAELDRELCTAVQEHLVSDVPVGAFLSGGIDSSLMVALMAATGMPKVQTFNVKFDDTDYDESSYAKMVAAHVGTEHHQLQLSSNENDLDEVGQILDHFDQPFGDSSAIPTYLICREIRHHVKVVISGDGGDEMFGGYPHFVHADAARFLGRAPQWILRSANRVLPMSMASTRGKQAQRLLRSAQVSGQRRLVNIYSVFDPEEFLDAVEPQFATAIGEYRPSFPGNDHQNPGGPEMIDATIRCALPGDYLKKVDVMSSAHGLEVRVPMLANRILDFAAKLPHGQKYSWRMSKVLLRRVAHKYLPPAVSSRKKQGFGIPFDSWLGEKGRKALSLTLLDRSASIRELIRPKYIENVMNSFVNQDWKKSGPSRYSTYQKAYALWSLERWLVKWRPSI